MAAPSYTNDLTDFIVDSDTNAWGELVTMAAGGVPDEADTESALQGTNSVSQATNTTSLFSMCRILASPVTLSAGYVFLVWHGHGTATAMLSYASGGLRLAVATDLTNWKAWAVGGNDVAPFPYAKWVNNPIDPTISSDYSNGTPPTTNYYGVGSAGILSAAVAKGQPHIVDIIRYGRAEARISGGETANYAIFSGFAALNDASSARWGLIQATTGGYLWKGLMTLGYSAVVDFRDSNKTIFIQDTRKVGSGFNKIEIRQASSRVDWTGISFVCLSPSTTASKGAFEVIDNADVNFETCAFTDMDTFIFQSGSTINDTTFRRCGQITTGGAVFDGCTIDNSTAATAVLASTPANAALITNTDFISDGTGHGIEITGTAANMTLTNVNFSGYAGSDGSSGNEAVYVNIGSGSMNLTISGGTTPSVRTAGAGVTVVSGAVDATLTVTTDAGGPIETARVLVKTANGTGPFPFEDVVNISNSGTTATVTHTGHAMASNDVVLISGASHDANNGIFTITKINNDSYSYTMGSTPGSSPTGTIICTFVLLSGTTNASGQITMSRVFPTDQPVTGWARKAIGSPFYKTGPVNGTVDSSTGATLSAVLVEDE
jgi:hypothetical protein